MREHELQPAAVIDGYRLEEKLHQGSMAALWRVTRDGATMPMVMKIPLLRGDDDPAALVGFEVEQMILPALTGPHVPRFIAAGDFPAQPYIVMECIAGESLRPRLEQAPLPAGEIAAIGARVAAALHDIHSQHVVHLDLKPSNVMFRASGEAVLIDFGLSHHDRLPDLLAEQFHLPMGTAPYMSPEQVRHVRNDPRSDLFALGVVLYHLATGERPYGNPSSVAGLRRRLYRDPVPPIALNPQLPPWLQETILRCLEVDPRRRFETAAQLAFELQHPDQIALTARAERRSTDGTLDVAKRWLRSLAAEPPTQESCTDRLASAPIVMVAIDLSAGADELAEALRGTVSRILQADRGARLACITVLKTSRIAIDATEDAEGHSLRVKRLAELKHWARPLNLDGTAVTCHVLEEPDVAAAIVEFARSNRADQIVIGARASSVLRRYLGSVSSQVVAEAPCTVTVVRRAAG